MKSFLLFILSSCFWCSLSYAQSGSISGSVTTADGQPAEFVNVKIKGSSQGAATNLQGEFLIEQVKAGSHTLVFSHINMQPQEISVVLKAGEALQLSAITLKQTQLQLQEVVIEGGRQSTFLADLPSQSLRIQGPLLEAPQNIQVITREVITNQQSFDMLEGIQRNVSGAQKVEHWDNYARINMRGSQVTAFRNGMNVQMPWGPLAEDMSMVERIEFVKGPAGFMLANGEPGGFYNVVTKKPSGQSRGEISFSLGSFDTYRITADADGKLSDNGKLLYRLNLMGQLKGSHRDYEYNNRYSIAPVLKYLIDDKSAITLEYTHQYSQMNVIGSNYAFSKERYADLPLNFTTAEPNLDPSHISENSVLAIFDHQFNKYWKFTAQAGYIRYQQEGQSLWPWSIGEDQRSMQRGISIWDALGLNKTAQFFLNGDFSTAGIRHKLLAGLDMGHKDYYADWSQGAALGADNFNIYDPGYGQLPASELPVWDRSRSVRERGVRYNSSYTSVYLQDQLSFFGDQLRLSLGARYTSNKYLNPYSGSTDDGKLTPRAALSYSLTKSTTAYFLYDQAFIANPGLDWQGRNFDPVTGDNWEAGLKKDWFGGRWNTTLSAYRIIKNNVLTTDLEHPDPETMQFVFMRQTGQQQIQGAEFDVRGELLPNLSLVMNYAYTDATITKDSDVEVVGNAVAGASRHIQNSWLDYSFRKGTLAGLGLSLGYQYQAGRSSWFVFDDSENSLPDYFRLDGGISYQRDQFRVNLLVNNLLNDYLYSGAPSYGLYYWQTEPPRNFRITVGYKF